jgi:hypothetical protein
MWADAIQGFRHYNPNDKNWKTITFFHTTISDGLYFASIATWLKFFNICEIMYHVKLTGTKIDGFLSFAVTYWLPFVIINYFLIFWKDRYKKIIEKYPLDLKKPSYSLIYGISSFVFFIITFATYEIVKNKLGLI